MAEITVITMTTWAIKVVRTESADPTIWWHLLINQRNPANLGDLKT
jgi:hypothetical protein